MKRIIAVILIICTLLFSGCTKNPDKCNHELETTTTYINCLEESITIKCIKCGYAETRMQEVVDGKHEYISGGYDVYFQNGNFVPVVQMKCMHCGSLVWYETSEFTDYIDNYEDICRNTAQYMNWGKAKIAGTVVQVINNSDENYCILRVEDINENVWYVRYDKVSENAPNWLEDDNVIVYGFSYGTCTYKSIWGEQITIPYIHAGYVKLNDSEVK